MSRTPLQQYLIELPGEVVRVRALLGHARLHTTQVYTTIRPPQLKRVVRHQLAEWDEIQCLTGYIAE